MKLNDFVYILSMFIILALLIYMLSTRSNDNKYINDLLKEETKKREDMLIEVEILKSEKKDLDLSIDNLKKSLDKKEKGLLYSIQEIKNKGNVQVRNVTDSSFISLLKELQPN
jgi:hypothetical protein